MRAEQQYIDLFSQCEAMICRHSAEVLNAPRAQAFADFEKLGFPTRKQEKYKYTDVSKLFEPDYGLNLNRLDIPVNPYEVFKCDVPNMSTALYFVVNDAFYRKALPKAQLPEGVLLGSLKELSEQYPALVKQYYGKLADTSKDGVTAFNTTFAQDGFMLYVPKGVVVDKPIQLVNILRADVNFMVNRRVLVVLEEGAQARLLICDHAMDNVNFLSTQVIEVFAKENATFDLYELESRDALISPDAATLQALYSIPQLLHSHFDPSSLRLEHPSHPPVRLQPFSLPFGRPLHPQPRFPDRVWCRHAARKTLPRENPQGPPDHRCRRQGHSSFARRFHEAARCSTPPHRAFGSLNVRSACGHMHPSPPPLTNSLFLQHSRQEPHPPPQTRRNVAAYSRPSPSQIPSAKSIHLVHRQGHDAPSPSHRPHRPSPDTGRFLQRTSTAHHRPLVKRSRFQHRHRSDTTSRAHNPYTPFPTRYV